MTYVNINIIQYFFKGKFLHSSRHFFRGIRTHVHSTIYICSRETKKERERERRRMGGKRKGRNAPRVSAYRLPVIYFLKFENYTAFNTPLAATPPPCFIHVAINKEQKTVFCKVTHPMPTRGRLYTFLLRLVPFHPQIKLRHQADTLVRVDNYRKCFSYT